MLDENTFGKQEYVKCNETGAGECGPSEIPTFRISDITATPSSETSSNSDLDSNKRINTFRDVDLDADEHPHTGSEIVISTSRIETTGQANEDASVHSFASTELMRDQVIQRPSSQSTITASGIGVDTEETELAQSEVTGVVYLAPLPDATFSGLKVAPTRHPIHASPSDHQEDETALRQPSLIDLAAANCNLLPASALASLSLGLRQSQSVGGKHTRSPTPNSGGSDILVSSNLIGMMGLNTVSEAIATTVGSSAACSSAKRLRQHLTTPQMSGGGSLIETQSAADETPRHFLEADIEPGRFTSGHHGLSISAVSSSRDLTTITAAVTTAAATFCATQLVGEFSSGLNDLSITQGTAVNEACVPASVDVGHRVLYRGGLYTSIQEAEQFKPNKAAVEEICPP